MGQPSTVEETVFWFAMHFSLRKQLPTFEYDMQFAAEETFFWVHKQNAVLSTEGGGCHVPPYMEYKTMHNNL